jgi:hypothetical protein
MPGRERDDLIGIGKKRNSAAHHKRVGLLTCYPELPPPDS